MESLSPKPRPNRNLTGHRCSSPSPASWDEIPTSCEREEGGIHPGYLLPDTVFGRFHIYEETCSSSSSSIQTCTYDVFVSFYGKDTRFSFTDHLFAALKRSGIRTFRDDRELERGKAIWTELEKAIETSTIAVIVFSENYAASRWCLDELEKIMECERRLQQIVLPVFYHVDPSDVRNQKGSLEKAFARHNKDRVREGKVARWRAALTKAASLSGWDLPNVAHRFESELIKKIIGDISNKLNLEYFMVASYPVGLETRMQNLSKLLNRDSSDVHMVGIWGIGGIGKTTIAKAIYNQLQRKFEGSCFLEDVREIAKKRNGLIDLQELILSSVHVNDNRKIKHVDQGTMVIKERAWCKRVLVVLDDVDHRDQLEKLAIRRGYFQPGSIIIITTRDKSMLKLDEVDEIYMPQELDHNESIKLLSWHAFGKDHPNENYAELSKEVICYARGLPLALKVLGSFLSDKSTNEWEGALEKLKVIPHDEIQAKLLVSFCSLSDTQKELFLDIACFFVGMEKNYTCKILQDSNLVLDSELGVLVRRSLVKIDCCNQLRMHDMIRDMGREVVRRQSTRVLGERSRLWFHEDVLDVLQNHTGTEVVEGIMLNLPGVYDLQVDSKAFARMHQLRVLQLNYACLKGNFQCPSKRLRYLEWYGFPLKTIPSDLHMENLVAIYMPYNSLIELWTGTKILQNLKFLDVSHSYHLMRTPDLSEITNLEVLVLNNCTSLVEVHNSVVHLNKLVTLDLADCKNLTKIPSGIYKLKSDYVNLSGCTKLDMVPRFGFTSPSTLRYSLCISSGIPLESFGFKISKLLQLKGLMDCASLVENHEAITNTFLMNKAITYTYDVFVSSCGKDTHLSFTDHLFAALYRNGIHVFRDDRKLRKGKDIRTELEKAIETSRIAIIVFSTNYAASRWCLDELAKIMECERRLQQIVLPVFYDVDPSDLRNQKGSLEKAFARHQERFREGKVARWRAALAKAASLSGWDLHNFAHRFKSELIKKIIGYIFHKLNSDYSMVEPYLVGLESRMQNLSKLLNRDSSDVRMVGIWGIGCIGKTTIAKAIYNQLQRKFEGSCFLEDVRKIAKKPNGLIDLQELILSSVHVNDNRKIKHVDQGTMVIKERAWCKRVLVVLDDVDHRDQLEKLAIRRGYFQPGSIIIITTRDKSMLKLVEVDEIYMPQALDRHESIKLLSWHAFGKDHPNENYAELSKEVICYARGLPLALKVLGSLLCGKSTKEWQRALERLKVNIPHEKIQEKELKSDYVNNIVRFHLPVIFNFHNHLTILNVSLSRRFHSLDELPICLQAMAANNATSLEWILTGSNLKLSEQLILSTGCSKLLKKNHTSNPRKKLLKESIAQDSFSVFLPGAEFPDWFNYKSTGSILSFVVPPLVKQKVRGWFLCAIFASRFHDIYGFTVSCKFKNNTKGTKLLYRQKNCRVIPCQEHLWLHSVLLHHVAHLLEAGDEVEYSIHVSGSLQLKKFGVNLIYENDEKDYQSYFEAMIQNASLPYKNDFLHEDVSTDQAMAGDQKIHPPYVQDQPSEGNGQRGWPYLHENPQGAMLFEGRAPFEQNMYSSGIPTINSMSQTERLRNLESEQMLWEAERQLLLHQLENEQRMHWAACEDAARASQQVRVQNAALERENIRLRMALAHASQFAPHFDSECASSAPTQSTIAAVTPMASTRCNALGLDYATYPESPVLSIQSFNDPSRSSPPNRGSDLPQ